MDVVDKNCSMIKTEEIMSLKHPSVTHPMEPDQVDYFPLPSGNLVFPVSREHFDFPRLYLCFSNDCSVQRLAVKAGGFESACSIQMLAPRQTLVINTLENMEREVNMYGKRNN